jgi:hypothetical protein
MSTMIGSPLRSSLAAALGDGDVQPFHAVGAVEGGGVTGGGAGYDGSAGELHVPAADADQALVAGAAHLAFDRGRGVDLALGLGKNRRDFLEDAAEDFGGAFHLADLVFGLDRADFADLVRDVHDLGAVKLRLQTHELPGRKRVELQADSPPVAVAVFLQDLVDVAGGVERHEVRER